MNRHHSNHNKNPYETFFLTKSNFNVVDLYLKNSKMDSSNSVSVGCYFVHTGLVVTKLSQLKHIQHVMEQEIIKYAAGLWYCQNASNFF